MKRTFSLSALCLAAIACGSSHSADGGAPSAESAPRAPDAIGGTPSVGELDEGYGVFVTPAGKDTNVGSRTAPFATLRAAIAAVGTSGKRVYVCEGTYNETIEITNGVSMVGGLVCSGTTMWTIGTSRSKIIAPSSPAMHAKDVASLTRIEGFEVIAPDAGAADPSSIALLAENASGLVLANMRIASGKGMKGADGADGVQLLAQVTPAGGSVLATRYACPAGQSCNAVNGGLKALAGGASGRVVCAGAAGHDGEPGGQGGSGGVYASYQVAAGIWLWEPYDGSATATGGEIRSGAAGAPGSDGASGTTGGVSPASGYLPADGANGSDGAPGSGGWGASGIDPQSVWPAGPNYGGLPYSGTSGPGGGAGGCPGLAGTAGKGGGASIAILLFDSVIAIDGSEVVASDGGAGGRGTLGSDATPGAAAGQPTFLGAGAGGAGGRAGVSGHGAGGPSYAIAYSGASPSVSDSTKLTFGSGGAGHAPSSREDAGGHRGILASNAGDAEALHAF